MDRHARGIILQDSDMDLLILLNKEKVSYADEKRISYPLYELEIKFWSNNFSFDFTQKKMGKNVSKHHFV